MSYRIYKRNRYHMGFWRCLWADFRASYVRIIERLADSIQCKY